MKITIRRVTENDAPAIVELLNPIIQAGTYSVMDETFTVEDQIDFIRSFPEGGVYHLAIDNGGGGVLGIQDVVPVSPGSQVFGHVGEISTFVALVAQGQGIGRLLSQATFQAARALGFRKLMATIRADNPGALAFYRRQGFEKIGVAREHAYLGGRYVDEVLMEKFLA
jgi:L-amino acid N-acyltransferase YncA